MQSGDIIPDQGRHRDPPFFGRSFQGLLLGNREPDIQIPAGFLFGRFCGGPQTELFFHVIRIALNRFYVNTLSGPGPDPAWAAAVENGKLIQFVGAVVRREGVLEGEGDPRIVPGADEIRQAAVIPNLLIHVVFLEYRLPVHGGPSGVFD